MSGIIFTKASGLNDSIYGKSQEPIKACINEAVESFQQTSHIDKIYSVQESSHFAEKFTTETAAADFSPVGENGAYPEGASQEGFSKVVEPEEWKSKFSVSQTMVEDAQFGKIKSSANKFSTSYNRTREKFAAGLLANGVNSTAQFGGKTFDVTCADGKPLFYQAHPSKTKGTKFVQSNLFKAAFSLEIMDQVQVAMQDFCDDEGNILSVMPDTIIIPNDADLKRKVLAAVGSDKDPNTANNALNFQMGLWNVLIWPYLPKTIGGEPFFMMMDSKFMQDYECAPWLDRVPLTVKSYIDENTDANIFKGRARFGAGFNNWRGIAICGAGMSNGTVLE